MLFSKHHLVEKDGTGIKALEAGAFHSFQASAANILQDATGEQGCSADIVTTWIDALWLIEETARH